MPTTFSPRIFFSQFLDIWKQKPNFNSFTSYDSTVTNKFDEYSNRILSTTPPPIVNNNFMTNTQGVDGWIAAMNDVQNGAGIYNK